MLGIGGVSGNCVKGAVGNFVVQDHRAHLLGNRSAGRGQGDDGAVRARRQPAELLQQPFQPEFVRVELDALLIGQGVEFLQISGFVIVAVIIAFDGIAAIIDCLVKFNIVKHPVARQLGLFDKCRDPVQHQSLDR